MEKTSYTVAVKTSDKFASGTDANVFLQLFGRKGMSAPIQLKESINHRNKFERNKSDVFFYDQPSVGDIESVKIWHDNSGPGPGWHLEMVLQVHDSTMNTLPLPL